jgi:flagellar motor switch/type III secretory pathway protein FliN
MIVDQAEIDKLLAQADGLVSEAAPAAQPMRAPIDLSGVPDDVKRMLRLRVPVIVRLACRRMPIHSVRKLSIGTIIEFEKGIDSPLDLMINNQHIGHGEAVKVGEHYGLRATGVDTPANRVRALGT